MFKILMPACALLVAVASAQAQDTQRYQLEKIERGYVRLDLQTGAMSICEDKETQLICRSATEEPSGSQGDQADRYTRLEQRVEALEQAARGSTSSETAEEFEQGLDRMERFFRRFMGLAREFDREKPEAMPDRT